MIAIRGATLLFLTALTLVGIDGLQAQETIFANGFEFPPLDCEIEGYPCSLADVDSAVLDRVVVLLQTLWDIRDGGTMDDARAWLETQPDILAIDQDYHSISFRLEGMPPVMFDDLTVTEAQAPAVQQTISVSNPKKRRSHIEDIVGGDTNSDSTIDQRDSKRALVLAPFEWQFNPNDESATIASRLELLRGYAGNVVFKHNPNKGDQNIALEDWVNLGDYDVIAVSTHGGRHRCKTLPDLSEHCESWISSGVIWDFTERPQVPYTGISMTGIYDPVASETRTYSRVSLRRDFWRYYYHGSLNHRLLTFSACETGQVEGSELAADMGSDDFVMTGWSEVVDATQAFSAALAFYEELDKGLNTDQAFDIVYDLGIFPYVNSRGKLTTFETFKPSGRPVRLYELPQLMYQGSVMPDSLNIGDLVTGTVGDALPDHLQLTVQIDGVTPDTQSQFQVHYRVQGQDVPGSYGLGTATLVDGYEYRYEVTHDVDLGFPLVGGDVPIEVIVDLPEGGDSRFSVTAFLASCNFKAQVSGDTAAFFDGPAQFEIGGDGAINLRLRSRGYINSDLSTSILANLYTDPSNPLAPGTYNIATADINFSDPSYIAAYIPGLEGSDCPSCGGSFTIDAYNAEQSLSGSVSVTMVRVYPPPPNGELPPVTLDVDFVAAFGSEFEASSPYVQCASQYQQ